MALAGRAGDCWPLKCICEWLLPSSKCLSWAVPVMKIKLIAVGWIESKHCYSSRLGWGFGTRDEADQGFYHDFKTSTEADHCGHHSAQSCFLVFRADTGEMSCVTLKHCSQQPCKELGIKTSHRLPETRPIPKRQQAGDASMFRVTLVKIQPWWKQPVPGLSPSQVHPGSWHSSSAFSAGDSHAAVCLEIWDAWDCQSISSIQLLFFWGFAISTTGYGQRSGACSLFLRCCSLSSKAFRGNSSSLWLLDFHVTHLELCAHRPLSGGCGSWMPCPPYCQSQVWSSFHPCVCPALV